MTLVNCQYLVLMSQTCCRAGAIYCWFKLPDGWEDDVKSVEWLVKNAGVCLVPGSSCKSPGWVRASFGNLTPAKMPQAAERLKKGLQRMLAEKPPA
jgi:aspartate/methionine/tyrosine aminotransferase